MMHKRNTEGYVLAYLLIVIAVMGAIAATLMTSTAQVLAAQQNSIEYMKDKYAAMGEVEKLLANLDSELAENPTFSRTCETIADTCSEVRSKLNNLTTGAADAEFNLPADDGYWNYENNICTFSYSITASSATITAKLSMPYKVEITSVDETETDPEDVDNPVVTDTDYPYTLTIKSLTLDSYEISPSETPPAEGGDAA